MFSFSRNPDKFDIGMFELPARHKLLDAKRATKRNKELSQLCDKLDDLVGLAGSLTRLMLEYVEKHHPASGADEAQEYEKFKDMMIDFDMFRLIKHIMLEHRQRTESASQLVDLLESVQDKAQRAHIIQVALEITINREEYTSPENVDTSMLLPPLSMGLSEFKAANKHYKSLITRVEDYLSRHDHSDQKKYEYLAQLMSPPRRSRTAKTMILVSAWLFEERNKFSMHHRDSQLDEFLRNMEADIDEQIAALQAGEPHSSCEPVSLPSLVPDIEALHNGMMEQRLRRLLSDDEESDGGDEQ